MLKNKLKLDLVKKSNLKSREQQSQAPDWAAEKASDFTLQLRDARDVPSTAQLLVLPDPLFENAQNDGKAACIGLQGCIAGGESAHSWPAINTLSGRKLWLVFV